MAEKKAPKKTATPDTTDAKVAEVKTTTKKVVAPKKAAAKKVEVVINAENGGFKAGDGYQTLATAEKALTVAEIAKAAKISDDEVLLGMGWLFKEGKIKDEDNKVVLA